jgi:glycosyltransferase involved in cell wall biosynthesis
VKLAIVHDYLSQRGGAERVVLELVRIFPGAPIFTSFYAPERTFRLFAEADVRTSPLQGRIDPERFRSAVLRYPRAFRSFDLSAFDTVIISSSAFAHHVLHPNGFVYCHTPPRFLHDPTAYHRGVATRLLAPPVRAFLRRSDRRAADRHRSYAANSESTARLVGDAYGRASTVIHPPLRTAHLPEEPVPSPARPRALVLSRLLPYKRVDVAIRACALAGIPLTVVGEGPEAAALRALAGRDVRFLDHVDDEALAGLFAEHSVVLVPGKEDFGIVPLEANYAGRPVVAQAAGGALETVVPSVTGLLVEGTDPGRWAAALRELHERDWPAAALRRTTEPFQPSAFEAAVCRWLAVDPPDQPVDRRKPQMRPYSSLSRSAWSSRSNDRRWTAWSARP